MANPVQIPRFEMERIKRAYTQTADTTNAGEGDGYENRYGEYLEYPMSEYLAMKAKYGLEGSAQSKSHAKLFYDAHDDEFYLHEPPPGEGRDRAGQAGQAGDSIVWAIMAVMAVAAATLLFRN